MQRDEMSHPRQTVIHVAGEMDMDRAHVFRAELDAVIANASAGVEVVVDLSGLAFCDSSGLNALLAARQHAEESGHHLRLAGPSPQVTRLLEITGTIDLFPIGSVPPA
ncbi:MULTISPECIES: STAS domain-containing protein [unclassified Streptomyces]|uniref:STAS domain-containing protein n=1 Tax=unclassified Streptomyces TaxID=2593676 RepID=UPI0037FDF114